MARLRVAREAVLGFRFRRHQLDRAAASAASVTDVDLLDVGVADTGPDGALWALAVRGAPVPHRAESEGSSGLDADLAYAWTVRSSPHAYRRADLLEAPYLRFCRPCDTTHLYELPFRLSALQAGLVST